MLTIVLFDTDAAYVDRLTDWACLALRDRIRFEGCTSPDVARVRLESITSELCVISGAMLGCIGPDNPLPALPQLTILDDGLPVDLERFGETPPPHVSKYQSADALFGRLSAIRESVRNPATAGHARRIETCAVVTVNGDGAMHPAASVLSLLLQRSGPVLLLDLEAGISDNPFCPAAGGFGIVEAAFYAATEGALTTARLRECIATDARTGISTFRPPAMPSARAEWSAASFERLRDALSVDGSFRHLIVRIGSILAPAALDIVRCCDRTFAAQAAMLQTGGRLRRHLALLAAAGAINLAVLSDAPLTEWNAQDLAALGESGLAGRVIHPARRHPVEAGFLPEAFLVECAVGLERAEAALERRGTTA